jgi:hypothetical protein
MDILKMIAEMREERDQLDKQSSFSNDWHEAMANGADAHRHG